jgi:hypothetical protein
LWLSLFYFFFNMTRSGLIGPTQAKGRLEWATAPLAAGPFAEQKLQNADRDPENKEVNRFDPYSKGLTAIDPENKGLNCG